MRAEYRRQGVHFPVSFVFLYFILHNPFVYSLEYVVIILLKGGDADGAQKKKAPSPGWNLEPTAQGIPSKAIGCLEYKLDDPPNRLGGSPDH